MKRVRAKFRCMVVAERWNGYREVQLSPVTENTSGGEDFWKYTPSGDCHLTYVGVDPPFKPGRFYYLDLALNSSGIWVHEAKTDRGSGTGEVKFRYHKPNHKNGFVSGDLVLGIDSQEAFDALGAPGSKWSIAITFAEASDEES